MVRLLIAVLDIFWDKYPYISRGVSYLLVAMGFASIAASIWYGIMGTLAVGCLIGFIITIAWVVMLFACMRKFHGKEWGEGYEERERVPLREMLHFLITPMCFPLFLSMFVAACIFSAPLTGKIWFVDGRSSGMNGVVMGIPFLQEIKGLTIEPNVKVQVVAMTGDGKKIEAFLEAQMRLVSDEDVLRNIVGQGKSVEQELEEELRFRFRQVVAQYKLEQLPNELVLEWETGNEVKKSFLTARGVEWAGTMRITEMHVYMAD
jgi:hypothetical protein